MEAERRACAENTLVNYMNNMFYPVSTANLTLASTNTSKSTYNPLSPATAPFPIL
jgi:hypothetical protein